MQQRPKALDWAFESIVCATRFSAFEQERETVAEAAASLRLASVRLLGLDRRTLEPGCPADLVLFDWEPGGDSLRILATVLAGELTRHIP